MTHPHLEGLIGLARWWQAVEDDKAYQGEAYPDDHTVVRYVGATCSPILTAGDIRAALAALPGGGVACHHEAYHGACVHCGVKIENGTPTPTPHEADRNG